MELVIANKKTSVLINDNSIDINGSHLQGNVYCSYHQFVEKLGEPEIDMDGDKVRAEWTIQVSIDDKKVVATIYDWKEYQPIENVTDWHIGGFDENSVKLIQAIFPNLVVQNYR
jgi:hypothetical protein